MYVQALFFLPLLALFELWNSAEVDGEGQEGSIP